MDFETRSEKTRRQFRRSDFHRKVNHYERQAEFFPAKYRWKVMAIALAGYAVVMLLLALTGGLIWLLTSHLLTHEDSWSWWMAIAYMVLGVVSWTIIRGLLWPAPFPNSFELDLSRFPELRASIRDVKKRLKIWRTPRILLTEDLNAFAMSRPMFGLFGPARHYVGLGLPLLHALNEAELSAVVAHEMAHLSRLHSRWIAWVHRLRTTWYHLLVRFGSTFLGRKLLLPFAKWYWGHLDAATIVLSRRHEIEANRVAARAIGSDKIIATLARLEVMHRAPTEDYWNELWRGSVLGAPLPAGIISGLSRKLQAWDDPEAAKRAVWNALGEKTSIGSTHPSFSETLGSLGYSSSGRSDQLNEVIEAVGDRNTKVAADRLLPEVLKHIGWVYDEIWRLDLAPIWFVRNEQGKNFKAMLNELQAETTSKSERSIQKLWREAWLTEEIYGRKSSLPLVRDVIEREPGHPMANFLLGEIKLEDDDPDGATALQTAIQGDPMLAATAKQKLGDYYWRTNDFDQAERFEAEALNDQDDLQIATEERAMPICRKDRFCPHKLSDEVVDDLRECLKKMDRVKRVYLVQKLTEHLREAPFYVVAVVPRLGWLPSAEKRGKFEFELRARCDLYASHQVIILRRRDWRLLRAIRRIQSSELLPG